MIATLKQGASKENIDALLKKITLEFRSNGVNTRKFCGVIDLKEDALKTQKRLRDEW